MIVSFLSVLGFAELNEFVVMSLSLMRLSICCLALMFLSGCYGVNKKTSEICSLSNVCLAPDSWERMLQKYSVDSVKDDGFFFSLKYMRDSRFSLHILYFDDPPKEMVGIHDNGYTVFYVYNPLIDDKVLTGLSPELPIAEKERIGKRVIAAQAEYQCVYGQRRSLDLKC